MIDNADDACISLNRHGRVTAWNRQAEQTFGWSAQQALGKPREALIIPAELSGAHRSGMQLHQRTGVSRMIDRRVELPALRRDGSRLTVEVRIRRHEVGGEPVFSAFLHDVTLRKKKDARREYESRHDLLTGLRNRRALMEALPLAQARASRNQGRLGLLSSTSTASRRSTTSSGTMAATNCCRRWQRACARRYGAPTACSGWPATNSRSCSKT